MSVLLRHPSNGSEQTVEDHLADYLVSQGWIRIYDAYAEGFAASNQLATPHATAPQFTGSFDVRVKAQAPDWTPAVEAFLTSKTGSAGNRGWRFGLTTSGALKFEASPDGTSTPFVSSSAAVPFANGTDGWVRAVFVASTGAVTFSTSPDGQNWTPLGTPQTISGAPLTLFNSTQSGEVGGRAGGLDAWIGRIYYVEWRTIDDMIVLAVDLDQAVGSSMAIEPSGGTFTDGTGRQWIRTGSAIKIIIPPALPSSQEPGYMPANGLYAPGAQRALIHKLRSGVEPAAIALFGDGLSNETHEWCVETMDWLGTVFPKYTVTNIGWDDAKQGWDPILHGSNWQRQVGSLGDAYAEGFAVGNHLQVPHSAAINLTGSMTITVKAQTATWTSGPAERVLVAKYGSAGNRGWRLYLNATGQIVYEISKDGTDLWGVTSSVAVPFAAGAVGWVRVVMFTSSGNVVFYTSTDGVNWTALGSIQIIAGFPYTVFATTQNGEIGSRGGGTAPWSGRIHYVDWRSGGDATQKPVVLVDFDQAVGSDTAIAASGGTFVDALGLVWTRTGSAIKIKGSPGLTLYNGAVSGGNMPYFNDGTRWPKLRAIREPDLAFIAISHSDGGMGIRSAYKQLADAAKAQWPDVGVVAVIQHPKFAPSSGIKEHTVRSRQTLSLAAVEGYGVIDHHYAFSSDPRGVAALVSGDGINPSSAGLDLNTAVAKAFFAPWVSQVRREASAAKTVDQLPTTNLWVLRPGTATYAAPVGPEGSMTELERAYQLGAPAMLLGVIQTMDGVPVLLADTTVDRTTNGTGNVNSYLAKDLPLIDMRERVGDGFPPEPIPTLDQILDRFGGKTILIIESKNGASGIAAIDTLVTARGLKDSVLIGCSLSQLGTIGVAATAVGFKLFVWSVSTVADVGTADAAGAFMVELPRTVATDRITACQAAVNIKRWVSWAHWRRNDKAGMTAGLHGWISEGPGYTDNAALARPHIADEVQQQKVGLGWFFSLSPTLSRPALRPEGVVLGVEGQTLRSTMLGSLCGPKPTTYSFTVKYRFGPFAGDTGTRPGFRVCCPSDEGTGADADTRGYTFFMNKAGALEIRTHPVGYGAGVFLASASSPAVPDAGGDAIIRFDVTPTTVALTRVETGETTGPIANTAWRGDYVWAAGSIGGSQGREITLLEAKITTP